MGRSKLTKPSKPKPRQLPLRFGPHTTVRDVGDRWTSGELARAYPDHVRPKKPKTRQADKRRLERFVYPVIGKLRPCEVTLEHADEILQQAPADWSPASRRLLSQAVRRLLAMSVYPLKLTPSLPVPVGWSPKDGPRKARSYLYPAEDAQLLACIQVPLAYRVLYGFLAREGMRSGEVRALEITDLDLDRGAVTLVDNKTDDPRSWALSPGVAAALRRWLEIRRVSAPTSAVFIDPDGRKLQLRSAAKQLRAFLRVAGIVRAELHEEDDERRIPMRLHDLRATFVTISLANGKTEAWVADRTGHRSSIMINRYRRMARMAAELGLGELRPLDKAIPEIAGTSTAMVVAPAATSAAPPSGGRLVAVVADLSRAMTELAQVGDVDGARRVHAALGALLGA